MPGVTATSVPDRDLFDGPFPLRWPAAGGACQLYVHRARDRFISRAIREQGLWEPFETRLLHGILKRGDVVIDAGANIGYFSILAAACVGAAGRVLAFEPEPCNCRLLRANCVLNGVDSRVQLFEMALAERDGAGTLYLHPDNLGDHCIYAGGARHRAVPIVCRAGAPLLQPHYPRINFLKLDTQGAEAAVLRGLLPLLLDSVPALCLLVELTPYALRQAGASGAQLLDMLELLELPFAIVDQQQQQLVPVSAAALREWCGNVDRCAGDQGFMNILVGGDAALTRPLV